MRIDRRTACALPLMLLPAARAVRTLRPAIQLFTARKAMASDPVATLRRLRRMGYREVETVGASGHDPVVFRRMLDRAGLSSPAQHIMPRRLGELFGRVATLSPGMLKREWLAAFGEAGLDATMDEAIGQARILGQRYIVWQMLWPEQIETDAAIQRTCRLLDRAGEKCAEAGLTFALHNQAAELAGAVGRTAWDRILMGTDPRLVRLELDFAAAQRAGRDPAGMLSAAPGRYALAHVRGTETDDRGAMLRNMLRVAGDAGVEHAFVDYERLADPLTTVARDAMAYRGRANG